MADEAPRGTGIYCPQHDIFLEQLMDIGNEIRHLEMTLVKVIVAAVSASSTVIGALVVI